jgi:hypothetical protein
MLFQHAVGVLHRHQVARKGHHPRAQLVVQRIKAQTHQPVVKVGHRRLLFWPEHAGTVRQEPPCPSDAPSVPALSCA